MQTNEPTENTTLLLEFKVGPLFFCVPTLDIEAIISPPEIIHIPLSSNVIAGCFNYKGRTVTVLSMHNKFGLPLNLEKKMTHILLATVGDELRGFWVDTAIGIADKSDFQEVEDYAPQDIKAYSNFLTRDQDIYLQTTFERLYHCAASDLNWLVDINNDATTETEAEIDEDNNQQANNEISTDKLEATQDIINSDIDPVIKPLIENNTSTAFVPVVKSHHSSPASSTRSSSDSVNTADHIEHYQLAPAINHSQKQVKTKNSNSEKKNHVVAISISLILLFIIASAAMFISDNNKSLKTAKPIDSYEKYKNIKNRTIKSEPSVTELKPTIEATQPVLNLSKQDKTSESQEELLTAESTQPETGRVFELHINEETAPTLLTSEESELRKKIEVKNTVTQRFTHVVVKGDTLWDITQRYLDNPHRYPELAKASDINNPHRIYPGDIIKIIVT
ncbi:MAG: chemotaxis protein CheW, partial [Gammaproteobacteria bacterium]|nr:chemotaxis protein CheW [Gammaproteobacteria bacterium]